VICEVASKDVASYRMRLPLEVQYDNAVMMDQALMMARVCREAGANRYIVNRRLIMDTRWTAVVIATLSFLIEMHRGIYLVSLIAAVPCQQLI